MRLGRLSHWARGNGLEILLLAVGAVLLARLVHWIGQLYRTRIDDEVRQVIQAGGVASERSKRSRAVAQAIEYGAVTLVYFMVGILILQRLSLPLSSLVAPATVAGVAIGFGAQQLVSDLLAGFFLFSERQFGIGDVILLAVPGNTTGISGTVEEITLRVTKLRTDQGELIFVPNGALRQVVNLSREWSRVVVDIPIPVDDNIEKATEVLREMVVEMGRDDRWKDVLLGEPVVAGVESIEVGHIQLRLVARTLPGKQFDVGRELRLRAALALTQAGLVAPAMQVHPPDT
jgi:small conductance mechanosensitive channel